MCGINGFSWKDDQTIQEMNTVTKNRGPDDEGVFVDNNVSLGHRRLSIIDLSSSGHQPMCNKTQTIWITYNGEIFNYIEIREELKKSGHVFLTESDTEVILHAYEEYGYDCLNKFNGMWAFCIYDSIKKILFLSRDQFGIKPLYYYFNNGNLIFSSMISGILCHNIDLSPNNKAIMQFLAYNLEDHETFTFFEPILKINPDSYLIFDFKNKTLTTTKWYNLQSKENVNTDKVRDEFLKSIKLRIRSDVPIGSCLSGGVDSSAIVAIMDSCLGQKFNTYSLIVPNSKIDESKFIIEVGKKTNTQQYFTSISADILLADLPSFIRAQEEPVTTLSPYAQFIVMKLAHQHGAKVLLDGQGGDEVFAGYNYYFSYYFYELFVSFKWFILANEMIKYRKNFKTFYPHLVFGFALFPDKIKTIIWRIFINKWINHQFLNDTCKRTLDPRWNLMTLKECMEMTLFKTAIPHLLRWEDKNSMYWSIESRPPFLDVDLVEAAYGVPASRKISNGETKVIFKDAIKDFLPDLIKNRKIKMGFETPSDEIMRTDEMILFCREIIYSESFKNRPYWNWNEIERQYTQHIQEKINIGDTIWKWINTELWLREYFPGT